MLRLIFKSVLVSVMKSESKGEVIDNEPTG